jgi:lipopolysaccharide export LptBFGC system permease protein LptF
MKKLLTTIWNKFLSILNSKKQQQLESKEFAKVFAKKITIAINDNPLILCINNLSSIFSFIKLEKMRGSEMLSTLQVERYNRDAIPVSVIILTIIGAVLASRKVRGGSGFHLALGILISVTYILFSRFSVVFATKGTLTPWIAAWLPNFIFGILAIYLYYRAPK